MRAAAFREWHAPDFCDDVGDHGEGVHGGHGCDDYEDVEAADGNGDQYGPGNSTTIANAYGEPKVRGIGPREAIDIGLRHRPT